MILEEYLDQNKYFGREGSVLTGAMLVDAASKYGVDPRLFAAITANESGWGTHSSAVKANNFSGLMGAGKTLFQYPTAQAGLDAAAKNLYDRYVAKGLTEPKTIGPVYAPTGTGEEGKDPVANDPNQMNRNWVSTVTSIMKGMPEWKKPVSVPVPDAPPYIPFRGPPAPLPPHPPGTPVLISPFHKPVVMYDQAPGAKSTVDSNVSPAAAAPMTNVEKSSGEKPPGPRRVKAINFLINSWLPEELRSDDRIYDTKGVNEVLVEVARRWPDKYPEIAKRIGDLGRLTSYRRGETFTLEDFKPVIDRRKYFEALDAQEEKIKRNIKDPDERERQLVKLYGQFSEAIIKDTKKAGLASRNRIAMTVLSGARGKDPQLAGLVSSPGFYADSSGRPVPLFVRHSFAEGLSVPEYLAGTYGARLAVVSTKSLVAKGGHLTKGLTRAAAAQQVSVKDCGTSNGIELSADDRDVRGRVLQKPVAGLPAGTVLDRNALAKIRASGEETLIVRSPMTCAAEHGICSRCFGVKAEGSFPSVGEHMAIIAAQAMGEPISQAALSQKHNVSASGPRTEFTGFEYINQFLESPEEFKDRAIVAEADGIVQNIREAPQGGWIVTAGNHDHYVPSSRSLVVKNGDVLEAGDQLSDGLVDAEDIVRLRGLGEGRKYFADRLQKMLEDSGAGMDRRNVEMIARSNVDHVQLEDPLEEGWLPDDVVRYSEWVNRRQLPNKVEKIPVRKAEGLFLEQPVLHYTVGTRITPRISKKLQDLGYDSVYAGRESPPIKPVFMRMHSIPFAEEDWLASLGTSYLKRQLQDSVMRARDTNISENPNWVPRLAGGTEFGKNLGTTGKF